MKKYNFKKMSIPQIEKAIVEMRAETEAIKKETEAIKKETELMIKAGEAKHLKNLDEIEAMKKENEAIKKETEVKKKEAKAKKKENEANHKKYLAERKILDKKRSDKIDKLLISMGARYSKLKGFYFDDDRSIEEIFFESINKTKQIGKTCYDTCTLNYRIYERFIELGTIDLILFNDKEIAIIEVNHRITKEVITQLKKTSQLYLEKVKYNQSYKINLFVAGVLINPTAKNELKINNIGFIKIKGEHYELVE